MTSVEESGWQVQRMLEITRDLTTTVSEEELLHKIVWAAVALTQTQTAGLLLFNEGAGDLRFTVVSHFADQLLDIPVPVKSSVAGAAFVSGAPVIVPDAHTDPRYYPVVEEKIGFAACSLLAVPLQFKERRLGVLEVENKCGDKPFTEVDVSWLSTLAAQAAIAIENARLVKALEQRVAEREEALAATVEQKNLLSALYRAGAALTGTLLYEEVLDRILAQVAVVVPYDAANVMLVEGGVARVLRGQGYEQFGTAETLDTISLEVAAVPGLLQMQQTLQPLAIPDVTEDAAWVHSRPEHRWIRSYVGVPIYIRERLLGFLNVLSAEPNFYTEADAQRLEALAHHVAVAIENAHLYQQAQCEIEERLRAERELQQHRDHLEELVASRTADLQAAMTQAQQLNGQLEQEILEREQLIADLKAFSHTVAHDLKGPLSIVVGYSDLLLEALLKDGKVELLGHAKLISEMSNKMGHIIDAILTFASLRQAEIMLLPLDMAQIVSDVERRLSDALAGSGARLAYPEQWPLVEGDAQWVEEVWVNYISNAIKYGDSQEASIPLEITLGWDPEQGGFVRFWVRDNGPGITSEAQARLFTPFTRLDRAHPEGHGLGLSIVKRMIEKLGGQVSVESAPGQGAVFSFTLPIFAPEGRSLHDPGPQEQ